MSAAGPGGGRRWRAGVAGLRRGLTYVRQLAAAPDVELAAVADLDEGLRERVRREHGVAQAFPDLSTLLDAGLDFVVIATPLPLHGRQAVEALERGVHVLSEVTAAATLEEIAALVDAVERTGKQYMMGENCNYWGVVRAARALHGQGAFGTVFYAEAEYIHDVRSLMRDKDGNPTWRATRLDPILYCTHSLGPIFSITGQYPTEVTCMGSGSHFVPGVQDLQAALIRVTDGGLVRLTTSFTNTHWGHHRYHLLGTKATLDTGWIGRDQPRFLTTEIPHLQQPIELPLTTEVPDAPAAARQSGHGGADWFVLDDFLRALRTGEPPAIDVYDAVMYTLPGICARESAARGGQPVAIPQYQTRRPARRAGG